MCVVENRHNNKTHIYIHTTQMSASKLMKCDERNHMCIYIGIHRTHLSAQRAKIPRSPKSETACDSSWTRDKLRSVVEEERDREIMASEGTANYVVYCNIYIYMFNLGYVIQYWIIMDSLNFSAVEMLVKLIHIFNNVNNETQIYGFTFNYFCVISTICQFLHV